jgi:ATP-dependent Clp protease ATP-binding subunit ClpC
MPDGMRHESAAADGCCIVFAGVTAAAQADDYVTVTATDAGGEVLSEDRVWFGGDAPRPGTMPTAGESRHINLERLSAGSRRVVEQATQLAQGLGAGYIGGEHILAALLREPDSLATRVLHQRGVTRESLGERIRGLSDEAQAPRFPVAHLSPRAERALNVARSEATVRQHDEVDPEHLLLGLTQTEGIVCGLLESMGTSCDEIRNDLVAALQT